MDLGNNVESGTYIDNVLGAFAVETKSMPCILTIVCFIGEEQTS